MLSESPAFRFQAAVERPVSLTFQNADGNAEVRPYCVTVITESDGLNEHEVVMDFRVLEAALAAMLDSFDGCALQNHDAMELAGVAKKISEALAPSVKPPAKLASVSLKDGDGRAISLQL